MDEIQRPARIRLCRDQDRSPCADGTSSRAAPADRQPFLAIEPIDAVNPRRFAFASEQDEQSSVAETPPLVGKFAKSAAQRRVRQPTGPIADHLAISADDGAGPSLRQTHDALQMSDSFALGGGPYHFLTQAPSGPRLRASGRPAASSALHSRLPAPSGAWRRYHARCRRLTSDEIKLIQKQRFRVSYER